VKEKCFDIKRRCYYFSKQIVTFVGVSDHKNINYPVFQQLLRSGTSIGANVVEAISASSKKDFLNYYKIALKSTNETKYWLCLIKDTINCDKDKTQELLNEAIEISKIIAAIIINTKMP
jgi:four helix bundle protein